MHVPTQASLEGFRDSQLAPDSQVGTIRIPDDLVDGARKVGSPLRRSRRGACSGDICMLAMRSLVQATSSSGAAT
eukprot:5306528-Pleurochrysis_carterae.AAC.1